MRLHKSTSFPIFLFVPLFVLIFGPSARAQKRPNSPNRSAASRANAAARSRATAAGAADAEEQSPSAIPSDQEDGPDQIRQREEWFYRQRTFPLAHIPAGARLKAFQHMQRMMEAEGKIVRRPDGSYVATTTSATSTSTWTAIGPSPTIGGFYTPTSGRVTTIAVDPNDASGSTLLIGAAQGGIWRSTDAGQTWTPFGDQNPSLAMGSIAFANPSSPGGAGIVYAGTGEQASIGFDVYYGAGVLKSTDGGVHWAQTCIVPSATCPFIGPYSDFTFGFYSDGGSRISYVAVNPSNPNLVLVAAHIPQSMGSLTAGGVYCSDDGGATWNSIPSTAGEMATFVGFANATTAYAALGRTTGSLNGAANPNGVYKSTNADGGSTKKCSAITFSNVTANGVAGIAASSFGRIDLGIAAADASGQTVYASIADASIDPFTGRNRASRSNLGVFKTTDGGATWTNTNAPDVCNPQCWYDNVIKVDPAKSNVVFFGGGSHFAISGGTTPTLIPSWVVRSTDGGITWNPALPSPLTRGNPGLPHVDQHAMAFVRAGATMRLYLGNDGGVWKTDDAEAAAVTWNNLNNSPLQITQFYPSLSIHPSTPSIGFGGTQDNGSQNFNGADTWTNNNACGDGGWTLIDPAIPSTVYILCQVISLRKSVINGFPFTFSSARSGINITDPVNFIAPIAIDPVNTQNLYFGTSNIYQSVDGAENWLLVSSGTPFIGPNGVTTALAVGGGSAGNIIYAAYSNGQLVAANLIGPGQANFSILGQGGPLPTREPTQIVMDPSDASGNTLYVTYSGFAAGTDQVGHIFKSVNAGGTWTDVSCTKAGNCSQPNLTTDLPNIPVNDLVIDPQAPGTLYAATDLGVFQGTCVAVACTWATFNNGTLPNVAVLSLRLHAPSRTLRAATHGRGVWDLILPGGAAFGVTAISPISANVGDPGVGALAVTGNGFTSSSQVTFTVNGTKTPLSTTFLSPNQLTATIPAAALQAQAVAQVAVTDTGQPTPTNSVAFPILAFAPTVTGINPATTAVQTNPANSVQVVITGSSLEAGSAVTFNPFYSGAGGKVKLATTFSSGQLTATVPANLLGPFGSTNDIQVFTPAPGGGVSLAKTFKVLAPVPANDNFANALDLGAISSPDIRDTSAATTETNDPVPPCGQLITSPPNSIVFGNSNSIWYKFTPATNGNLSLNLSGTSYVSWLSVWTGASQAALAPVPNACSGLPVSNIGLPPQLSNIALSGGTTYYIMVGSAGPIANAGVALLGPPIIPNPIALGGKSVLTFSFLGTPDFSITSSGTTTLTVNAGQTATFSNAVSVSALNGLASQVNLSCSLPVAATATTCTVNPNALPGGSGTASVSVTTMARGLMPPSLPFGRFYRRPEWVPLFLLALLLAVVLLRFARTRRQRLVGALPLAVLALFFVLQAMGCGGGSSYAPPPPPPTGTPAGTYTLTVTGTSGNLTHTTTLTLTVN